jgi:Pyruvate/2-oxoacid:ferredoxin oxidoreductase delta subunit
VLPHPPFPPEEPADHHAAARQLALGARAVALSGVVTRHGLGVVNELHAGLSFLLAERGLRSVAELVGSAPATDGAAGEKVACEVNPALCAACGNCTRCPSLAIALDAKGLPAVELARCTGCGACVQQCFTGALSLRSE